ncbi:hypothetical protein [Ideonella alba]|uniref:Uncharacterized protein n=1 Tax=Ideonella alba TaxID=2824118 RepID=A0A941BHZ0_9BURK|nr:hypothetical protein [Ideonella alba]MBQ0933662.1 hypothetical protein [Ideonella alba]
MYRRIRSTLVGLLLGLTAYVTWLTRDPRHFANPDSWDLSGIILWFLAIGAALGFVGGLSFVERWLEDKQGELFENTLLNALSVLALLAVIAIAIHSARS